MFQHGGIRRFFIGSSATIYRDIVFGGTFSFLRHNSKHIIIGKSFLSSKTSEFIVNMIAASIATILSSPLNYIRVVHYATLPNEKQLSSHQILKDLVISASKEHSFNRKFSYIQSRLRIGWGTARVGCGMAFSASLYKLCSDHYQ